MPHLFPLCTTWIGFRRDRFLRDYMHAFIEMMIPDIDRDCITRAIEDSSSQSCKVVRFVQPALADESEETGVLRAHPVA